jgi:hypothetical protein
VRCCDEGSGIAGGGNGYWDVNRAEQSGKDENDVNDITTTRSYAHEGIP